MGVAPYGGSGVYPGWCFEAGEGAVSHVLPEYEPDEGSAACWRSGGRKVDKLWKASGCQYCNGTGYSRRSSFMN